MYEKIVFLDKIRVQVANKFNKVLQSQKTFENSQEINTRLVNGAKHRRYTKVLNN